MCQKRALQVNSPNQERHLVAKLKTEHDFSKEFLMSKQSILQNLIWYRALILSVDWCLRPSLFRALRLQVEECLCYYNLIFSQMVVNGKVFLGGIGHLFNWEKNFWEHLVWKDFEVSFYCCRVVHGHFFIQELKKVVLFFLVQNQYSST